MKSFKILFDKLAQLPVNEIRKPVAVDALTGNVPVVTSEVASGKTMLIPATMASIVEDMGSTDIVYVLTPTRNLANNAVDSLWELMGDIGPNLVGCYNGSRADDESRIHKDNRLVFTTVGYALSSGLINRARYIVLDEAHELSLDLSLVKALLHRRKSNPDDDVAVVVMSATLDCAVEKDFWESARAEIESPVYTTKGSAFPVEFNWYPAATLAESVAQLVEAGCTGVLVFVEGTREIADARSDIVTRMNGVCEYEVASIWGGSNGAERRQASARPTKSVKILIGTNVLESGISLPWVDGGVSSGNGKVMEVHGNIHRLVTTPLPQWRVHQQQGRCGRFKPGRFILASQTPMRERAIMQLPEIQRLPLTELVLHCAKSNIAIQSLRFTSTETPNWGKVDEAVISLEKFGFIKSRDGILHMTREGRMIEDLPLSFRGAAAYCEAVRLNRVVEMLPLIALIETGDMRHDLRERIPPTGDCQSDLLSTMAQIYSVEAALRKHRHISLTSHTVAVNFNTKKYREYQKVLDNLEEKLGIVSDFTPYRDLRESSSGFADKWRGDFAQVLFRAYITDLYKNVCSSVSFFKYVGEQVYRSANLSNTSSLVWCDDPVLAGSLRIITPKMGNTFIVLENVTAFQNGDYASLRRRFGAMVDGLGFPEQQTVDAPVDRHEEIIVEPQEDEAVELAMVAAWEKALSKRV